MNIRDWQKIVYRNAKEHGWFDDNPSTAQQIALMHAKLSEALQEDRMGMLPEDIRIVPEVEGGKRINKITGLGVELADCIFRILSWAGNAGVDMETIMELKHKVDVARPYKHGGKAY